MAKEYNITLVSDNSDLGQFMSGLDEQEERNVIKSVKQRLEKRKITKEEAIQELKDYMEMFWLPKEFKLVKEYLQTLTK